MEPPTALVGHRADKEVGAEPCVRGTARGEPHSAALSERSALGAIRQASELLFARSESGGVPKIGHESRMR